MSYDHVTDEMYDNELARILATYTGDQLLSIPGVYEVLREEFNNQVLDAFEEGEADE